jgi:MoxR-like ATPase
VLDAGSLAQAQDAAMRVGASDDVIAYAVDLARATRQSPSVKLGVSPRGTTGVIACAKAWAWLNGFDAITPDHIQAMVLPVFRHRLQLTPEAELEGVSADSILRAILAQVRVPI